jgi:hypothetical protein
MFNERTSHIQQRIVAGAWRSCSAQFEPPAREKTMRGSMMAFGIAIGIATLICYLLVTRLQNRRVISGSPRVVSDGSVALISATAEAISPGAEMIAPQPVIRALRATVAEVIAGEAMAGEAVEAMGAPAEAINNSRQRPAFRAAAVAAF